MLIVKNKMTCVWDGLIKALKLNCQPKDLLKKVKKHNIKTKNVLWNNQPLTKQNYKENIKRIKAIKKKEINDGRGYDCSSCDPLLFLIAQLFKISIVHYCYGVNNN